MTSIFSKAGILFFLISSILSAQDVQFPKITRDEVSAVLNKKKSEWTAKIRPGQERLFFNREGWTKEIEKINQLQGKGAVLRQTLLDSADRICASTIPVYCPPDKMPAGTLNVKEEGWIRGFGGELACLAVAAKIKPDAKYKKGIHDRVLAGCKFDTWGRHGKNDELVNMDLAAGSIVRGIAMAYDLNRDAFTDEEKVFIRGVMAERVHNLLEGLYGAIFWSNWYTQNHNHVSVAGLAMAGAAFYDEIPEAPEWLAASYLNFKQVEKTLYEDGSSYEGVAYWGYGRSYLIQYLEATKGITGADEMYSNPGLKNAAQFRLGCSVPGFNGTLLWSDSRGHECNTHIMACLASQYKNKEAQYFVENSPFVPNGADNVALAVLMYDSSIEAAIPKSLDYHADVWDVVTTRSGWGEGDYMLSLKAGYNTNHHTQLDAGSLTLNMNGGWLLTSSGYGLGVGKDGFFDKAAKTGKRWNFLSSATQSHSTLLINGENQRSDKEARAIVDHYISNQDSLWFEVDMKNIYEGKEDVRRRIYHRRGDYVLVLDSIDSSSPVTVEWLAQVPPSAVAQGQTLNVPGGFENLTITSLSKTTPFQERKPTSPILDVSPTRLKTMSVSSTGTTNQFAVLLVPTSANFPEKKLKSTFETNSSGSHTTVLCEEWKDDVWIQKTSAAIELPSGMEERLKNVFATALAVRQSKGKVVSIVLCQAQRLKFDGLTISSAKPFDLSLMAGDDGWILSLGTEFEGTFSLPSKDALFEESGKKVDASNKLSAGNYVISKSSTDAKRLAQWKGTLFPPHTEASAPVGNSPTHFESKATASIKWEAETSPIQDYGFASVVDNDSASGKKALVTFGAENFFHKISWKVKVPSSGMYNLKIRYAADQPKIHLTVLVDGVVYNRSYQNASVNGPKGWGRERYWKVDDFGWIANFVEDDKAQPILIPLTEGEHEISLARPSSGLNLDSLELVGSK